MEINKIMEEKEVEQPVVKTPSKVEARPEKVEKKTTGALVIKDLLVKTEKLSVYYGTTQAVKEVSVSFPKGEVTALIGPSGCGKSTLLRCFNRMNDLIEGVRVEGSLQIWDEEINRPDLDVITLRRKVGMVFQKYNPFPTSIYENVVYGLRIAGIKDRRILDETAEKSLKRAALWDEVKDRLKTSALDLSGGQMQRLCIARTIAINPGIILMDEPCSALDPRATARIEDLIEEFKGDYTIIIVTHNMQQAARVSDYTAFLYEGKMVEFGLTKRIFTNPREKQTEDYITGRFG